MSQPRIKLGYRECTAADCTHPVHYRSKECPSCGAVQIRVVLGNSGNVADPSSVGTTEAAPQVALPEPAPVRADGPYVVAADCRPQIDNVMAVLRRGQVLTDWVTIGKLLDAGAPIVPQNQAHGLACCPRCQNIFAPTPLVPQKQRQAG